MMKQDLKKTKNIQPSSDYKLSNLYDNIHITNSIKSAQKKYHIPCIMLN